MDRIAAQFLDTGGRTSALMSSPGRGAAFMVPRSRAPDLSRPINERWDPVRCMPVAPPADAPAVKVQRLACGKRPAAAPPPPGAPKRRARSAAAKAKTAPTPVAAQPPKAKAKARRAAPTPKAKPAASPESTIRRELKRARIQKKPSVQTVMPVSRAEVDVKLGTDFAGMDSPLLALRNMGFSVRHVFTSEKNFSCNKLSATISPMCEVRYKDVKDRETEKVPQCDLYVAGVPCTAWCNGGNQAGLESEAGKLWAHSLDYIIKRQPKVFVLECAPTLCTQRKFEAVKADILKILGDNNYIVHNKLIRTDEHGLPQTRSRWYIVGVKTSAKRRVFEFPTPLTDTIPLERIIPGNKVA